MVLLKDAHDFTSKPRNVKQCVFLTSRIAFEHIDNQAITLPIIGVFLTLRDSNLSATMASMAKLDSKYLQTIEKLAK